MELGRARTLAGFGFLFGLKVSYLVTPLSSFSIDLKVSLYPFSSKDVSVSVGKHGITDLLVG